MSIIEDIFFLNKKKSQLNKYLSIVLYSKYFPFKTIENNKISFPVGLEPAQMVQLEF